MLQVSLVESKHKQDCQHDDQEDEHAELQAPAAFANHVLRTHQKYELKVWLKL